MIRMNSLLLSPIINLLYTLAIALALTMFGIDALHSPVEAGMIYAFVTYVQAFNPMTQMMDFLSIFTDGIVAGSRIFKNYGYGRINAATISRCEWGNYSRKIEFRNVTFSYDGKNEVLKNISFVANPGKPSL